METFKHEPLDHTRQSIRLLHFPTNDQIPGILQCTIRHATISAKYTCLSYRWGDDVPTDRISINGKEAFVRRNLFNFLQIASKHDWQKRVQHICNQQERSASPERWYWIDAVCIDQNNPAERNHQVQQMGKIFANAEQVFMWLGNTENDRLLSESITLMEETPGEDTRLLESIISKEQDYGDVKSPYDAKDLLRNDYWSRAWVTQEVVLARHAVLLANKEAVELRSFASRVISTLHGRRAMNEMTLERFWVNSSPFMQFTTDFSSIKGTSLVELLVRFKDRKCTIARDRIFSLLSICGQNTRVKVDYSLPDEELVFQTLVSSRDQLCLCSAATVARALEVKNISTVTYNVPGLGGLPQPYIEIDVHAQFVQPNSWCVLHSDEHEYPRIYLGEGPGTVFNSWETCPMGKDLRIYWLHPSTPSEKQTIWAEPFRACDNSQLIPICQYDEGFHVRKKYASQPAPPIRKLAETSTQSRLSTGADDLDVIRWNFDHGDTPGFYGGDMSFYGIEQDQNTHPEDFLDTLHVYTIRLSFPVLAKMMMENVTWYNSHCDFKKGDCSMKGFEYARIGHEARRSTS